MRNGVGTKSGVGFADGGQSHLHLSDAPGSATGSSGKLSEVRHGIGAEDFVGGRRRKSRTGRYDATILDRRGAYTDGFPACNGACVTLVAPRKLVDGGYVTL